MEKVEAALEETYALAAWIAADNVQDIYDRIGSKCESDIERVLLLAFIRHSLKSRDMAFFSQKHAGTSLFDFCDVCVRTGDFPGWFYVFQAQATIDPYRADFVVMACDGERRIGAVVECDGHEFHERTKEQAARDRRRDREMLVAGWYVFRFTGSEIWKDADACVFQVMQFLGGRLFE